MAEAAAVVVLAAGEVVAEGLLVELGIQGGGGGGCRSIAGAGWGGGAADGDRDPGAGSGAGSGAGAGDEEAWGEARELRRERHWRRRSRCTKLWNWGGERVALLYLSLLLRFTRTMYATPGASVHSCTVQLFYLLVSPKMKLKLMN